MEIRKTLTLVRGRGLFVAKNYGI